MDNLPGDLDADDIAAGLTGTHLVGPITVLARVDSTMDRMAEQARDDVPEGAVVIADHQSAGSGRSGRAWVAPPGTALLASILFRPRLAAVPIERLAEIPMAVALAATDAIAARLPPGTPVALKWPNDVLADGSKIGGLVTEASWPADRGPEAAARVIVGIGLNVRQGAADLPPGATSLAQRTGVKAVEGRRRIAAEVDDRLNRARLAIDLLNATDRYYADLVGGGSLIVPWSARLATLGQAVEAAIGGEMVRGRAVDVVAGGGLVVETEAGERVVVWAGDVLPRSA